jgi:hypothetical protein
MAPLRVIDIIGVVEDFAFALASKQKYQAVPKAAAAKKHMLIMRAVVLVVMLVIAAVFVFHNS